VWGKIACAKLGGGGFEGRSTLREGLLEWSGEVERATSSSIEDVNAMG